jgi:excisionase family DNA binding protein
MAEEKLLTPEQTADHLRVSLHSVQQALKEGGIPAVKRRGEYRIPLNQLEVWARLREVTSPPRSSDPQKKIGVVARCIPGTRSRNQAFGFIVAEDGSDVFLGESFIQDLGITTGDLVEFITVPGRPYPGVGNVKLLRRTEFKEHPQVAEFYKEALDMQQQGRFEYARRHFRKAIDKGAFLLVYTTFAEMEKELGRLRSAVDIVCEGLKVYPFVGKLYHLAAELLLELGEPELAVFWLEIGIQQAPAFYENHLLYLRTLMAQRTLESFQAAVDHAKSLDRYRVSQARLNDQLPRFLRAPQLPHDAYRFFIRIGFEVDLKESTDRYVDLLVSTGQPEYVHTYGFYKRVLARCFIQDEPNWETIDEFREIWQAQDDDELGLNADIAFAVLKDVTPARSIFYRYVADSKDTIVPLDERVLRAEQPSVMFRDQLSNWLSRRDLYAEKFPVSGRQFFGREVEIQGLMRGISEGRNVGIFGLRKVGKTSVLYQLRDKSKQDLVAYIDLQSFPAGVHGTAYLYWSIAREVYKQLHQKYPAACDDLKLRLGSTTSYDYVHQPEARNASRFDRELKIIMRRLSHVAPGVKVVILIDELERMLPTGGRQGFPGFADFFAHIRGLAQQEHGRLVSGVAAANPLLSEKARWDGIDNPVFRYYEELYLPLLAEPECKEMVTELGRRMAVTYTLESLDFIYDQTGGHPFLVRLFCSHALSRNPERPIKVTRETLIDCIDSFLFDEGSTFREILERLEQDFPLEYDLLLFIVSGVQSKEELAELVTEPVNQALRHLIGYQLISYRDEVYTVKINLLSEWLYREGIVV